MPPWAPTGDKWPQMAMVWVKDVGHCVYITDAVGCPIETMRRSALRPMPPIITPEQQAVLEAAERQERAGMLYLDGGGDDISGYMDAGQATNRAVRALRKSLAPVDPVAKSVRALIEYAARYKSRCERDGQHDMAAHVQDSIDAAIAALEAKS